MLFKTTKLVMRDLGEITLFPSTNALQQCTGIPSAIADKICFFAGTTSKFHLTREAEDFHGHSIGRSSRSRQVTPSNQAIHDSAKLLCRLRPKTLIRGSLPLYVYLASTHLFPRRNDITPTDCPDSEWNPLISRIIRAFHPDDLERKLVVRCFQRGTVHIQTLHIHYRIRWPTPQATSWRWISHIPFIALRMAPESQKAMLIARLFRSSLKFNYVEEHTSHLLRRIAEFEPRAFNVFLQNLGKRAKKESCGERRIVRKTITAAMVADQIARLSKSLSPLAAVEQSVAKPMYLLNSIKTARFPRDLVHAMFHLCRYRQVKSKVIEQAYKCLCDWTGRAIALKPMSFLMLTPMAFDLACKLSKKTPNFDEDSTYKLICANPSLFSHIVATKRVAILDVHFDQVHFMINSIIGRAVDIVLDKKHDVSMRYAARERMQNLRQLYSKLLEEKLESIKLELS